MSRTSGAAPWAIVRSILVVELRQLVRDRRALFAAVILPALLYPVLFLGQGKLEEISRDTLASREVNVAVDLGDADPDVTDRVRTLLEQATPIQVYDVSASRLRELRADPPEDDAEHRERERRIVRDVFGGTAHLLVLAERHPEIPSRTVFHLYYDVKDEAGHEARSRAEAAIDGHAEELVARRRAELLGDDPGRGLDLEVVDVATGAATSGAALGRLLPLLAVLVVLSGGSYAALAVYAGERENGTLETLLVQPVPSQSVAWGKFLAVLTAGLVTLGCNLASLLGSVAVGLGSLPGLEPGETTGGIDLARLLAGVVYLPGCFLLCAILCLVCGRARTFREGQMTILPVMLATVLPTLIVMSPDLTTTPLLAAIPFAGPALAMRDSLRGELALLPLAVMFVSHAGWCWLALTRLSSILDAERILSTSDTEAESAQRHASARHALRWGFGTVLAMYVIGGEVQGWHLERGLLFTFWMLLPALGIVCAVRARRYGGGTLAGELGLRLPAAHHVLGALLVVPGLGWLTADVLLPWQMELLPMPQGANAGALEAFFDSLADWQLLFYFAISPGIWEELVFRGALLSSMRRDLGLRRVLLWQAVFFAAAHASVYRLIPTATLALVLTAVTLRGRSVIPAVVVHAGYNGWVLFSGSGRGPWAEDGWLTAAWAAYLPWLAIPGLLLLALPRRPDPA